MNQKVPERKSPPQSQMNDYENRDFVGTFGFHGDDASKSVSGFKETPNISYIAQLEKEFAAEETGEAFFNGVCGGEGWWAWAP